MLGRKGLGDAQSWQEEDSGVRRLWAEEEVVTRPGEWSVLGASRKQVARVPEGEEQLGDTSEKQEHEGPGRPQEGLRP